MIFQLYNFNLSFISFFTLFIYMNIIILICLPFSIIKSYLWFIYFFFASIKGMLFVINHDIGGGRAWYNKIFNLLYCIVMEILLFFCYIICALFLFTIGNTLNLFVILSSIILCLTCQSILWPIIDSVKSFKIINNIIKGYCNGMRNEYYQNIKNGKQIRYTCNSNINDIKDKIKDISNDNFENNYILKSSIMLDDEENNKDIDNEKIKEFSFDNGNLQSIFKSSTFLLSLHNSERPDKKRVTIPLNYFENTSFIKSIYQIWKYRLNSSIILCGRWWRIICSHPLGIYFIVFPSITKQIYLNGYEGYRFFWWHKKQL
ncbi:hypothetical protein LY90DRAFT_671126 [Neocallimastix californiae]|uniref:Uncharacterized protein n=1 Tax=Neocallimastix californiae TaxID=1754190 RepID=A0A1Y2CM00_9FUNG|nr:hypothetical protein LY90DRAFT_671126 [Neocallimastix californiae]|eukprot:ORY47977.1 hypothetical protein LY90DRAFT_671126 [Neocallimastix californiae]